MTEYELINLHYSNNEATREIIMNFVTILSGYLIASHYISRHITIIQFIIMTTAYSIIMLMTIYGVYSNIQESILIWGEIQETQGLFQIPYQQERDTIFLLITFALSFIGSIYFGFTARGRSGSSA